METHENLRLLGLSRKEERVLFGVQNGLSTPVSLSRVTKVTRPSVYNILRKLKERGLVVSRITKGKKRWQVADERTIEKSLYDTKKSLLRFSEGREEVYGLSDSMVVIHRGEGAIKRLMEHTFSEHKGERLRGFQGNVSTIGWDRIFTTKETNAINNRIKDNAHIVEGVLPEGWFERSLREEQLE